MCFTLSAPSILFPIPQLSGLINTSPVMFYCTSGHYLLVHASMGQHTLSVLSGMLITLFSDQVKLTPP